MGFLSVPNLLPLLIFRAWIVTDQSVLLAIDHMALQLDREGIKWREDGETGGGETIIRGRLLFYIFPSKGGDYPGVAINRGTAIIRGNTAVNTSTMSLKNWDAI